MILPVAESYESGSDDQLGDGRDSDQSQARGLARCQEVSDYVDGQDVGQRLSCEPPPSPAGGQLGIHRPYRGSQVRKVQGVERRDRTAKRTRGALLPKGIPIDAVADKKHTALFDAVIFAQQDMVRFLLDRTADPRIPVSSYTPARGTPLHCVGAERNAWGPQEDEASPDLIRREVSIAQLLIQAGADLEATDDSGATPLHQAATSGNAELAALLLAWGAKVNPRDNYHNTPLHYAQNGHIGISAERDKVAELLLKRGATE